MERALIFQPMLQMKRKWRHFYFNQNWPHNCTSIKSIDVLGNGLQLKIMILYRHTQFYQ